MRIQLSLCKSKAQNLLTTDLNRLRDKSSRTHILRNNKKTINGIENKEKSCFKIVLSFLMSLSTLFFCKGSFVLRRTSQYFGQILHPFPTS